MLLILVEYQKLWKGTTLSLTLHILTNFGFNRLV